MIKFNSSLKKLKRFILENGKISNWNYSENLLVEDILIKEGSDEYKVVMIRYYKATGKYYYTDQAGEESTIDYITKWCSITT
jgi:hypothetical protein